MGCVWALARSACVLGLVLGVSVLPGTASAQSKFPNHPVTLIIPAPPGGPTDTGSRILAEGLARVLGVPVVPQGRPGAGTVVGSAAVARAAPDGYTIGGLVNAGITSPFALNRDVPYKVEDLAPIGIVGLDATVITVRADGPAKSLQDVIADAKAHPKTLSYGAAGVGSMGWVAMEIVKAASGADVQFVPYDGTAPVNTAVMSGDISLGSAGFQSTYPLIKAGKLRALAITRSKRLAAIPDVPTVSEVAHVQPPSFWLGVFAPAKTPKPVFNILVDALRRVMNEPTTIAQLEKAGFDVEYIAPEQTRRIIIEEIAAIKKIASAAPQQ